LYELNLGLDHLRAGVLLHSAGNAARCRSCTEGSQSTAWWWWCSSPPTSHRRPIELAWTTPSFSCSGCSCSAASTRRWCARELGRVLDMKHHTHTKSSPRQKQQATVAAADRPARPCGRQRSGAAHVRPRLERLHPSSPRTPIPACATPCTGRPRPSLRRPSRSDSHPCASELRCRRRRGWSVPIPRRATAWTR